MAYPGPASKTSAMPPGMIPTLRPADSSALKLVRSIGRKPLSRAVMLITGARNSEGATSMWKLSPSKLSWHRACSAGETPNTP